MVRSSGVAVVGGGVIGLALMGQTLNLYSQVGIVMLVGLAAKNGILIVEFANQLRDAGRDIGQAIREASARRLRPILMTSIAFILGVLPLVVSSGAGSASQRAIGTGVLGGMVTGTALAVFFVPVFFVVVRGFFKGSDRQRAADKRHADAAGIEQSHD